MIVVLDGPAGAGKSSTAKAVAARSGFQYLDSGAFYRGLTVVFRQMGEDIPRFLDRLPAMQVDARYDGSEFRLSVDHTDLTDQLRLPETSARVSVVAALPEARAVVNQALRRFVTTGDFIGEGRDLGTAVFPDADLKIWLTADLSARAERRALELEAMGLAAEAAQVRADLAQRDRHDSTRQADPLRKADDAVEVDTTHRSFDDQVAEVLRLIAEKRKGTHL